MIRWHFQKVKLKAPSNQHIDKLLDKVRDQVWGVLHVQSLHAGRFAGGETRLRVLSTSNLQGVQVPHLAAGQHPRMHLHR